MITLFCKKKERQTTCDDWEIMLPDSRGTSKLEGDVKKFRNVKKHDL